MNASDSGESVTTRRPAEAVDATAVKLPPADATLVRRPGAPTEAGLPADAAVGAAAASDVAPDLNGKLIAGRYQIETLIGSGGMGMVYSAIDRRKVEARNPNPRVAIKLLNADFRTHADAFVTLEREASKAQALAHPNIVTVFNFDRDGDTAFVAMELLHGKSLDLVIREARSTGIGRDAALPIIRGIAEGLAYAHRKGVVHSDLKPANVFLLDDGTPKILDFGIARAVPGARAGEPQDEFDAGRLGGYTELYATQEMIAGSDPAPADDLYALGAIAYELLSGRHPYGRKSVIAAKAAGLKPTVLTTLRRHERQLMLRSVAFERAERPRDAGEFLRLLNGAAPWRKALIVAVVALALVSGYLWYRNYRQSGPAVALEQLPPAVQQEIRDDLAEGEKAWQFYHSQGIGNALSDALDYFAAAYRLHPRDRDAVRGLRRTADEILKRVQSDPQQLHDTAAQLAQASDYLRTYPPVVDALKH
jgi:serine/threonine protein kinase